MAQAQVEAICREDRGGWHCSVNVREGGTEHEYQVFVSHDELAAYAPGTTEPKALVVASFHFLLEREPAHLIMRRFELSVIESYFPEYGRDIANRL